VKSIYDKSFKYVSSYDTDVKKTMDRFRKEMKEKREREERNQKEADEKVKPIAMRKA
jgi:hypothetical protein